MFEKLRYFMLSGTGAPILEGIDDRGAGLKLYSPKRFVIGAGQPVGQALFSLYEEIHQIRIGYSDL